jgi:3-oxoacyl-[acyl-carrier protein] reductase
VELQDRVALVTGAGRGIGLAIGMRLGQMGAHVIVAELADYGEQAAEQIRAAGSAATFVQVDVADADQVRRMADQARQSTGRVDVLVNNAGSRPTRPFLEMSLAEWQQVVSVNLTGTYNCCAAIAPMMVERRWGRIINVSSLAAQRGSTGGHSHYAAAKAGVVGLSKSLARELARYGITVNVVSPGWIETEGWQGELESRREEYAARVPVGRLGTPEDVAHAVSFLASEEASYLTGITLPINGGLYLA